MSIFIQMWCPKKRANNDQFEIFNFQLYTVSKWPRRQTQLRDAPYVVCIDVFMVIFVDSLTFAWPVILIIFGQVVYEIVDWALIFINE